MTAKPRTNSLLGYTVTGGPCFCPLTVTYSVAAPEGFQFDDGIHTLTGESRAEVRDRLQVIRLARCPEGCECGFGPQRPVHPFDPNDCSGAFDGNTVISDADPGL
jgi:hypothetical protein